MLKNEKLIFGIPKLIQEEVAREGGLSDFTVKWNGDDINMGSFYNTKHIFSKQELRRTFSDSDLCDGSAKPHFC